MVAGVLAPKLRSRRILRASGTIGDSTTRHLPQGFAESFAGGPLTQGGQLGQQRLRRWHQLTDSRCDRFELGNRLAVEDRVVVLKRQPGEPQPN